VRCRKQAPLGGRTMPRKVPTRNNVKAALIASGAVHAAIGTLLLGSYASLPQSIPITVVTNDQFERLTHQLPAAEADAAFRPVKDQLAAAFEDARHLKPVPQRVPLPVPKPRQSRLIASNASPARGTQSILYTAAPLSGERLPESAEHKPYVNPHLTVTGGTDWQGNLVEDNKLVYSPRESGVRVSIREASSAGFVQGFSRDLTPATNQAGQPVGLAAGELSTTTAISQKVDWTVVNSKNFGLTVFSYQNQVGDGFKPFGTTKAEFATAGTRMMKTGGQVRLGAVGFGFSQAVTTAESSPAILSATQKEVSVSLALPQLLPNMEKSVATLLPTSLWASVSDKRTLRVGSQAAANDTISTSFGGTWNWDSGYATLSYWNYSSGNNPSLGATWDGKGVDANLGTDHSAFSANVGLSYGRSADAAGSWQSADDLYFSSVTVAYKPAKLPGMWVTAAHGNYNHDAIAYGGILSDLYLASTNGQYSSLTAGLDLTNWFRGAQTSDASLKLLYRYSENALSNNSAQNRNTDNLVAVMAKGTF
jgi:hypothetical protein